MDKNKKMVKQINAAKWWMVIIYVLIIAFTLLKYRSLKAIPPVVGLFIPVIMILFVLSTYLDDSNDFGKDLTKENIIIGAVALIVFSLIFAFLSFVGMKIYRYLSISFEPISIIFGFIVSIITLITIAYILKIKSIEEMTEEEENKKGTVD